MGRARRARHGVAAGLLLIEALERHVHHAALGERLGLGLERLRAQLVVDEPAVGARAYSSSVDPPNSRRPLSCSITAGFRSGPGAPATRSRMAAASGRCPIAAAVSAGTVTGGQLSGGAVLGLPVRTASARASSSALGAALGSKRPRRGCGRGLERLGVARPSSVADVVEEGRRLRGAAVLVQSRHLRWSVRVGSERQT